MTTLALLKHQTQSLHAALERDLAIEIHCSSLNSYRALLSCFYGFYLPLETALARIHGCDTLGLDFHQRSKHPLLKRDLLALGMTPQQIVLLPIVCHLPDLASVAAGLGCWYVLEGATLGGQLITRQVRQQLGLSEQHGLAFFNSYGAQVGPMWRAFGAVLNRVVSSEAQQAEAVAAACATFTAFHSWIQNEKAIEHV